MQPIDFAESGRSKTNSDLFRKAAPSASLPLMANVTAVWLDREIGCQTRLVRLLQSSQPVALVSLRCRSYQDDVQFLHVGYPAGLWDEAE